MEIFEKGERKSLVLCLERAVNHNVSLASASIFVHGDPSSPIFLAFWSLKYLFRVEQVCLFLADIP